MRIAFDAVPDGTYDPLAELADLYISFYIFNHNRKANSVAHCRIVGVYSQVRWSVRGAVGDAGAEGWQLVRLALMACWL